MIELTRYDTQANYFLCNLYVGENRLRGGTNWTYVLFVCPRNESECGSPHPPLIAGLYRLDVLPVAQPAALKVKVKAKVSYFL